jgi:hypothetical protein
MWYAPVRLVIVDAFTASPFFPPSLAGQLKNTQLPLFGLAIYLKLAANSQKPTNF